MWFDPPQDSNSIAPCPPSSLAKLCVVCGDPRTHGAFVQWTEWSVHCIQLTVHSALCAVHKTPPAPAQTYVGMLTKPPLVWVEICGLSHPFYSPSSIPQSPSLLLLLLTGRVQIYIEGEGFRSTFIL